MRKMRDGEKVLVREVGVRGNVARKARAYRAAYAGAPPDTWRAFSTKFAFHPLHGLLVGYYDPPRAWWFNATAYEGVLWCRGWSGPAARAFRASLVMSS